MGFLTNCTWVTGSCQWTLDDRQARGAGQRRPYRCRVSGFRLPVAPHSLAGRRAPKPRSELCGGSLVLVPCFFAVSVLLLAAAMSIPQTRPPFSPSLPFPSIAALIFLGSLLTFSRAVALPVTSPDCGAPSPAAPAPALSRSALLANAGISVFSHYLSLFFRFCVPNFFLLSV